MKIGQMSKDMWQIDFRTIVVAFSLLSMQVFSDANAVWKVNVPRLVQSWNRFILQQIFSQCSANYDKNGIEETGQFKAKICLCESFKKGLKI
jgi:hypothetical protein